MPICHTFVSNEQKEKTLLNCLYVLKNDSQKQTMRPIKH